MTQTTEERLVSMASMLELNANRGPEVPMASEIAKDYAREMRKAAEEIKTLREKIIKAESFELHALRRLGDVKKELDLLRDTRD